MNGAQGFETLSLLSTVPGEILGETRVHLERLRSDDAAIRLKIGDRIDEALLYLDRILGP
jgi:hypothetical protein